MLQKLRMYFLLKWSSSFYSISRNTAVRALNNSPWDVTLATQMSSANKTMDAYRLDRKGDGC